MLFYFLVAYAWPHADDARSLAERIAPPPGYQRAPVADKSFPAFLRDLPLKTGTPPVHLYDGRDKGNQSAHAAVIDLDVGPTDLQQCADSVIRLRAEFLYAEKRWSELAFHATSGDLIDFDHFRRGDRVVVRHNRVTWQHEAAPNDDYATFRAFLDVIFEYAGTHSLAKEMSAVADSAPINAGEVFITGGFPGHVVLVLDRATNPDSGETVFLLGQGYMPAQDFQLLKNPKDAALSPWYKATTPLNTPEWVFAAGSRRRF